MGRLCEHRVATPSMTLWKSHSKYLQQKITIFHLQQNKYCCRTFVAPPGICWLLCLDRISGSTVLTFECFDGENYISKLEILIGNLT